MPAHPSPRPSAKPSSRRRLARAPRARWRCWRRCSTAAARWRRRWTPCPAASPRATVRRRTASPPTVLRRARLARRGAGALPAPRAAGGGAPRAAGRARRSCCCSARRRTPRWAARWRWCRGPSPASSTRCCGGWRRPGRRRWRGWTRSGWTRRPGSGRPGTRRYGPAVRAIAAAHRTEAPLDLTLAPGAAPPEGGEVLPTGTVRFPAGTRVTELPGFAEGALLGAGRRRGAAGPAARRRGRASAWPTSAPRPAARRRSSPPPARAWWRWSATRKRAARLRENLARLRLSAEVVEADATGWDAGGRRRFDAVLLDAPCTATGTIRRHPDVPFLKQRAGRGAAGRDAGGAAGRGGAAARAGRAPGLRHLLAPAGGRRGAPGDRGRARPRCPTRCGRRRCRGWKRR